MNKHTKMAIYVAPILIVLGYVASDYYLEQDAEERRVYQIQPSGPCNIVALQRLFEAGDLKLDLFDVEGMTTANATYAMDAVTLLLVDEHNQSTPYEMKLAQSKYYWHAATPIRSNFEQTLQPQKLRLIVKIKGSQYISEFVTSE